MTAEPLSDEALLARLVAFDTTSHKSNRETRAQALAIVVGSPELTRVRCKTIEEMKLVNLLCRVIMRSNREPRLQHRASRCPHGPLMGGLMKIEG
jgi:hypothetical protein